MLLYLVLNMSDIDPELRKSIAQIASTNPHILEVYVHVRKEGEETSFGPRPSDAVLLYTRGKSESKYKEKQD